MDSIIHPELVKDNKAVADVVARTVAMMKLAALKAVAHHDDPKSYPLPADPSSIEQLCAARFATRPAKTKTAAIARAKKVLTASPADRTRAFGELAKLDLRSNETLAVLASHARMPLAVAKADVDKLGHFQLRDPLLAAVAPPPAMTEATGAPGKKLAIRIHQVICADETDGFLGSEMGNDEIGLGGITVDETGDTKKVPQFTVGTHFNDGVRKIYDPPKQFCAWDITEGKHWPKTYVAGIYLCELDNGGFPGFLNDVLHEATKYVGTLLGGAIGSVFGPLGTLIGSIVGTILDVFCGWIVDVWEDDVFPAITIYTDIKSAQHVFASGTRTSGLKKYWASAHGGKYWVYLDWQITS